MRNVYSLEILTLYGKLFTTTVIYKQLRIMFTHKQLHPPNKITCTHLQNHKKH